MLKKYSSLEKKIKIEIKIKLNKLALVEEQYFNKVHQYLIKSDKKHTCY